MCKNGIVLIINFGKQQLNHYYYEKNYLFSVAAFSCKKNVSDAELTTQSTTVVAAYPGTSVEVKDGVAHLSGTFASQGDKDAAIAALKNVKGVRDVMDMATVEAAAYRCG